MFKFAVAFLLVFTTAVSAQEVCARKDDMVNALEKRVGEHLFGRGTINTNKMLMFVDPIDRSWTVLVVRPDGLSCIAATGNDFETETLTVGDPS
jgi:NAD(P)H-hydrate repair Nnr-like enzyme with NAD(P)H-hydrate dehydratase domain